MNMPTDQEEVFVDLKSNWTLWKSIIPPQKWAGPGGTWPSMEDEREEGGVGGKYLNNQYRQLPPSSLLIG